MRPLADAIRAALEPLKHSFEVVLVDDGSADGSWDLLQKMCAEDRRICGLRLGYQSGQSAAMWAGLRSARGNILMTLDADLQNPPQEILGANRVVADRQLGAEQAFRRNHFGRRLLFSRVQEGVHRRGEVLQGRASFPAHLDQDGRVLGNRNPDRA
jgi:glycosyltransferase involved in cell wall biosynthesis